MLAVLAKRSILDASLGPEYPSRVDTTQLLKFKQRYLPDSKTILWDGSYFRDSDNLQTTKTLSQKLLMELHKWKLQVLFR